MNNISLLDIVDDTTVDGPGFRTAIYASGCPHACRGCHNPQSWQKNNGTPTPVGYILDRIKKAEFANVTFTGGDPLMQPEAFTELARRIKQETTKTIWCYTGYQYEQLIRFPRFLELLRHIDVLVDGRYMEALRSEELKFRGSANQRMIDVPFSLRCGKVVLWGEEQHTASDITRISLPMGQPAYNQKAD